ncbi:hypothetical protein BDR04DRAFT_1201197 [Suillus decipiens]|nr:hypothetical protein BDR04DRAFT_1201197 [Suillus decipiens]
MISPSQISVEDLGHHVPTPQNHKLDLPTLRDVVQSVNQHSFHGVFFVFQQGKCCVNLIK